MSSQTKFVGWLMREFVCEECASKNFTVAQLELGPGVSHELAVVAKRLWDEMQQLLPPNTIVYHISQLGPYGEGIGIINTRTHRVYTYSIGFGEEGPEYYPGYSDVETMPLAIALRVPIVVNFMEAYTITKDDLGIILEEELQYNTSFGQSLNYESALGPVNMRCVVEALKDYVKRVK